MRKWIALVAALVLAASLLTACGGKNAEAPADAGEGEYDFVICSGGGYNIVAKSMDGDGGSYDMVGVTDDDGEWVHALSKDHPFIEDGRIKTTSEQEIVLSEAGGGDTLTDEQLEQMGREWKITNSYVHVESDIFACVVADAYGRAVSSVFTYSAKDNAIIDRADEGA